MEQQQRKSVHEHTDVVRDRKRCKVPQCSRPAMSRGLCIPHYQTAYQLVCTGVISWDELVVKGKANEVRVGSSKAWFLT